MGHATFAAAVALALASCADSVEPPQDRAATVTPIEQDNTASAAVDTPAAELATAVQASVNPAPAAAAAPVARPQASAKTTAAPGASATIPVPSEAKAVPTAGAPNASLPTTSSDVIAAAKTSTDQVAAPSHNTFDALLKKHVDTDGGVDYAGMKRDHAQLRTYLQTLQSAPPQKSWSRAESLSYWINAYNAATLDLILDNYPLESIQDLDGGKPWDVKRVKLGEQTYSLNQIENDIIRPRYREPRIHFAVNCAAKGCPPLRNEAYTAAKLERQLEEQTRRFINNSQHQKLAGNTLTVSKIFDWYGSDFENLQAFIGKYRDLPSDVQIQFGDYDWSLNEA